MRKTKLLIIFMILILFSCVFSVKSYGASSYASISANKTSVNKGETVTITVTFSNVATWKFNVSGAVSGEDADAVGSNTSKSYTYNFTPNAVGNHSVNLSYEIASIEELTNGEKGTKNVGSKSVTINVTEPAPSTPTQNPGSTTPSNPSSNPGGNSGSSSGSNTSSTPTPTPSNNANLKMLGVTTYDFSGFKKDVTSYNTTVPNDVTSVNVYSTVAEAGAKVTVIGNTNLQVGTNKIVVRVTAPDGKTTKDYNIFVARQSAKDEEVIPNVIEDENKKDEEKKEHKGLLAIIIDEDFGFALSPEFKTDIYKYKLKITGDIDSIPLEALAIEEDAIVKVIGNEKLIDGKNTIIIEVSFDDDSNKKFKYEITVYKNADEDEEVEEDKKDDTKVDGTTKEKKGFIKRFLESSLAVAVTLFVVVFIVSGGITYFLIRDKKTKSPWGDDDDEDEIESLGNLEDEINERENTRAKKPRVSEEPKKSNKKNLDDDFSKYRNPRSGGRH